MSASKQSRKEILIKYQDCPTREYVNKLFEKLDKINYFNDEWVVRSGPYGKLNWRNNERGINRTIDMLDLKTNYDNLKIVDAGAGTGKISLAIAEYTDQENIDVEIYAIDQSYAMLNKCPEHKKIKKYVANVEHMTFIPNNSIDRVICSMVLHSEFENANNIIKEFRRILKKGGILIIFESIPMIDNDLFLDFYMSFLAMKEKRIMFTKDGLIKLMKNSNFNNVAIEEIILERQSIKNWLNNSCTENSLIDTIMNMHRDASETIKKGINFVEVNNENVDIFCDWKFGIVKCVK